MVKLVGFLAQYEPDSTVEAVDQLLDACMVEVERGKDDAYHRSKDTVPVALHAVAVAIDKYGLPWTDRRQEMFQQILGRIPVPRRFEYADLFRPKIADGTPSI